jgi:4-amino-4-deoxy-L-arabinose transferase-like glycosyltransferase
LKNLTHSTTSQFAFGWSALLLAGLLTVLLSHLGYIPLDMGDEARRALVSLEMILSGDYITPTLNGERYFNKPPLYNWLIVASYRSFGNYSAFALRFPMIVSLLLFGLTVAVFVRRYTTPAIGFATALMVLTTGRVLLYDSMLGLIEITFSGITYLAMMLVYHYDRKGNYWLLYLTTYTLTAIGFLLKGLPPIVFQAFTLAGWFLYTRQFKRLFHPAHLAGLLLFLALLGLYYVTYLSRNAIPFVDIFKVLVNESAKRTALTFSLRETVLHLLTFPVEVVYHFLPYLLLLVLLFRRDLITLLKVNSFVAFNALTFSTTVLIYWFSPQVYGRYLIGLMPLLFTIISYLYYEHSSPLDRTRRYVEQIWFIATAVVALGAWTAVFYPTTRVLPGVVWKTGIVSALLAGLAWQLRRPMPNRLGLMLAVMIVIRLGFNWLVLPGRAVKRLFYQDTAEQAAALTAGHPLYGFGTTVGNDNATDVSSFHIAALRSDILRKTTQKLPGAYYIADSVNLVGQQYRIIGKLTLFDRHPAYVVSFSE